MKKLIFVLLLSRPALGFVPSTTDIKSLTFSEVPDTITNPERGFYRFVDFMNVTDLSSVLKNGFSLVYGQVNLSAFRATDVIPASYLSVMDNQFSAVRRSGLKIIIRPVYNDDASGLDAPKDRILKHLDQLGPIFKKNTDVIAFFQAGLIGAWGEWHGSSNGLSDQTVAGRAARAEIVAKFLSVITPDQSVSLRTPRYKQEQFGTAPLTFAQGFSGIPASRVGHHNDCFLSSPDDYGTYGNIATEQTYMAQDDRFVPFGGETCNLDTTRASCSNALLEQARLRTTYMNYDYNVNVLNHWRNNGCFNEIQNSYGYRLSLKSAAFAGMVKPGGQVKFDLVMKNSGWASLLKPRELVLVLTGPVRYEVVLPFDPRRFEAKGDTLLSFLLQLPTAAQLGDYKVSLWFPDLSPNLRGDSRFAVRLANGSGWDASTGLNTFASLKIDPSASGDVNPTADKLAIGDPNAPVLPNCLEFPSKASIEWTGTKVRVCVIP